MTNPGSNHTSSSKNILNKCSSKQALKEINPSPLNIKIDLFSSLNTEDSKILKNVSTHQKSTKNISKEENIKVFIRMKPKTIK